MLPSTEGGAADIETVACKGHQPEDADKPEYCGS